MTEEKGAVAAVEPPTTDTTHVDEVLKGVQDLPEVGIPEVESAEIVVPSEKQVKIRKMSEKKLKQLENARASKKQKKLSVENSLSLLKEDHEAFKQHSALQAAESQKQWEARLAKQQSEYDEKHAALELKLSQATTPYHPPYVPTPPTPVYTPPTKPNFPVRVASQYDEPAKPFIYF